MLSGEGLHKGLLALHLEIGGGNLLLPALLVDAAIGFRHFHLNTGVWVPRGFGQGSNTILRGGHGVRGRERRHHLSVVIGDVSHFVFKHLCFPTICKFWDLFRNNLCCHTPGFSQLKLFWTLAGISSA